MPIALNSDYLSSTGLSLPEDLTEQQVDQIGQQLATIETGMQWWIGDYWNYRQRNGWGDGPEIAEILDIDYETCRHFTTPTSVGHLMPVSDADRYCILKICATEQPSLL